MSKRTRIEIVKTVLREQPDTRRDGNNYHGYAQKKLLVEVWKRELQGKPFTPENIMKYCSSATGVSRDRLREEVVDEFPKDEDNYDKMVDFRDEFSDFVPHQVGMALGVEKPKQNRIDLG